MNTKNNFTNPSIDKPKLFEGLVFTSFVNDENIDFYNLNPVQLNNLFSLERAQRVPRLTNNKCPLVKLNPLNNAKNVKKSDILNYDLSSIKDLSNELADMDWYSILKVSPNFKLSLPFAFDFKNDFNKNTNRLISSKIWNKKLTKLFYEQLELSQQKSHACKVMFRKSVKLDNFKLSKITNTLYNYKLEDEEKYLKETKLKNIFSKTEEEISLYDLQQTKNKNAFNEIYFKQKIAQEIAFEKGLDFSKLSIR
jgi:hypothetical protein